MNIWIVSAAVSVIGHGALALWLGGQDAPAKKPKPPTVVRFQAWRPEEPKPPPPPKVEPPPPPPQKVLPPKVVQRPKPRPSSTEPPPPATQTHVEPLNSGITPDASASQGDLTTTAGGGVAGPISPTHGRDHVDAPTPPAPPARPKTVFVPIPEVSRLPRAIDPVQPEVPEEWKASGRDAIVVVEVAIDAHGKVIGARAIKLAGHGLDEAAVAAAKQTRFEPALVGDKPVAVRMQLPYRFKVRG